MRRQLTPYLVPILLAAAAGFFLAAHAWRRRTAPGALSLVGLSLATSCWLIGYALELSATPLPSKIFWAKVQYFGIAAVPLTWLTFAVQFSGKDRWLSPRNLLFIAAIPAITLVLVWTNDQHQWVWSDITLDRLAVVPALNLAHGPAFWVYWTYSQTVLAAGAVLVAEVLLGSSTLHRWQVGCVLLGVLAPWVGNGIYILGLGPLPNLDLTPFAFTISCSAFAWSLLRHHLLDIVPVAQRAVMDGMTDGVIVLDPQNRVVDLNPSAARLLGRSPTELLGHTLNESLAPWCRSLDGSVAHQEVQLEVTTGPSVSQRHFDVHVSPLNSRHGPLSGHLAVLHDVTERKETEALLARARDQALEASQLKTELLANVSHELRTPLSVILGFTEMLHVGAYGELNSEQREVTEEIIGATRNLTTLVNELLDQAQLEAGQVRLHLGPFPVAALLDSPLSRLRMLAQAKGLSLRTSVDQALPRSLVGDRGRLEQILVNLVSNAIKYTPAGRVEVGLQRRGPAHWALQVRDSGVGVPPEAQSYIFEPFRQVDGSATRVHGGVGLGLSIVKQFTGLMGGRIDRESTPGQGSTFTVTFPLNPTQSV